uniref:Reverse transcriptase N-terminal domain-containing protein n=1 Tax=Trichogloeopsis pedicellata TaxID=1495610 RepID=A0A1G4P0F9_9FLOR|nr:Hypothetical protein ORF_3 [Trichogloeopsis pedicellata]SCW24390.1 Hypothetical protein ORF_3 [Trichogloeopsis pedicellata]
MTIVIQDIREKKIILNKITIDYKRYKLFYLQKRIYQASQECNYSLVHSLQKLLLSLKSLRSLAEITINTKKSDKPVTKENNTDQQNIDQQLILWCLEAEWQTKLNYDYKLRKDYYYTHTWLLYTVLKPVPLKLIETRYLVNKLQTTKQIKEKLLAYLSKQHFNQSCYSIPIMNYCKHNTKIVHLLIRILYSGIDWHYYQQNIQYISNTQSRLDKLYDGLVLFIPDNQSIICHTNIGQQFLYNIGVVYNCYFDKVIISFHKLKNIMTYTKAYYMEMAGNELILLIRNTLYNKDKLGRYRIKLLSQHKKLIKDISQITKSWKWYYRKILTDYYLQNLKQRINTLLSKWFNRQHSKLFCTIGQILQFIE